MSVLLAALFASLTAQAGYEASSFKKESKRGANFWNANAALDSRLDSCWMIDPEQKNEGQWIQLDIPSAEVDKIAVVIGWEKTPNTFSDYARVKTARIEVVDMTDMKPNTIVEHTVNFEDKPGWQVIDIPNGKVKGEIIAGRVRMTVTEVYPGADYPNLAVSEFRVHLKEFKAETLELRGIPTSEADNHTADLMIDSNPRTFWASTGEENPGFSVAGPGYGLASIGLLPGPKSHARPKTVEITANDMPQRHTLEDKAEVQWILLPAIVGYTGSAWAGVDVKVIDTYPAASGSKSVAISEVHLNAATVEDF
jgi:hypothetical protein